MNPAALLSKLTAKSIPLEVIPSSFSKITQQDVLHSMALVSPVGANLLLRIKYAGQNEFVWELSEIFCYTVKKISEKEAWEGPKNHHRKDIYRDMVHLAIAENISPKICLECGGCGMEITMEGKLIDCRPCRGSGKSSHSDRSRARLLDFKWEEFRDKWVYRYRRIQGIADSWESIALSTIHRKLQEND